MPAADRPACGMLFDSILSSAVRGNLMHDTTSYKRPFNYLMYECFRLNRSLVAAAAKLTEGTEVSGAQWGVLSVFAGPDGPNTVAEAARRVGLTRQSVQRVADLLAARELLEYFPNPNHRRAKLAMVTHRGKKLLRKLQTRQVRWAERTGGDLDPSEVEAATRLVRRIRERLVG